MNLSSFVQQRNDALLSLSADKIMRIFKMDGRQIPQTKHEFWCSVHKARLMITSMPRHIYLYSKNWLKVNDSYAMNEEEIKKWL